PRYSMDRGCIAKKVANLKRAPRCVTNRTGTSERAVGEAKGAKKYFVIAEKLEAALNAADLLAKLHRLTRCVSSHLVVPSLEARSFRERSLAPKLVAPASQAPHKVLKGRQRVRRKRLEGKIWLMIELFVPIGRAFLGESRKVRRREDPAGKRAHAS